MKGKESTCGCGVHEGQIHDLGCDMENCPFCGGQLITCDCCYEQLSLNPQPGTRLYKKGLSRLQGMRWLKILEKKGRIPYIQYPLVCAYCGTLWPELFMVSNDEWKKYIEPQYRTQILCQECYDRIKQLIDEETKTKEK